MFFVTSDAERFTGFGTAFAWHALHAYTMWGREHSGAQRVVRLSVFLAQTMAGATFIVFWAYDYNFYSFFIASVVCLAVFGVSEVFTFINIYKLSEIN